MPENNLDKKQRRRIAEIAYENDYLKKISSVFVQNYINVRSQWNKQQRYNKTFVLISTDSNGTPDFQLYSTFDEAEKAYFELYSKNNENRNIVLTHIRDKSFNKVSTAYSNYFMTYNSILVRIHKILSEVVVQAYYCNSINDFSKYYRHYLDVVCDWYNKKSDDLLAFVTEHYKSPKTVTRTKSEWFTSLAIGIHEVIEIYIDVNKNLKWSIFKTIPYLIKKSIFKDFSFKLRGINKIVANK